MAELRLSWCCQAYQPCTATNVWPECLAHTQLPVGGDGKAVRESARGVERADHGAEQGAQELAGEPIQHLGEIGR